MSFYKYASSILWSVKNNPPRPIEWELPKRTIDSVLDEVIKRNVLVFDVDARPGEYTNKLKKIAIHVAERLGSDDGFIVDEDLPNFGQLKAITIDKEIVYGAWMAGIPFIYHMYKDRPIEVKFEPNLTKKYKEKGGSLAPIDEYLLIFHFEGGNLAGSL